MFSSFAFCLSNLPPPGGGLAQGCSCTNRIKRKAGGGRRSPTLFSPHSLEIYRQKWYIASGLCRESGVAPTLVVREVGHTTFTLSLCPLLRGQ